MTSAPKDELTLATSGSHVLQIRRKLKKAKLKRILLQFDVNFHWAYSHLWLCHRKLLGRLPPKTQCRTWGESLHICRKHSSNPQSLKMQVFVFWLKQMAPNFFSHLEENSAVKCSKASASFSLFSGTGGRNKCCVSVQFKLLLPKTRSHTHRWFSTGWRAQSEHLRVVHAKLWSVFEIIALAVADHVDVCTLEWKKKIRLAWC